MVSVMHRGAISWLAVAALAACHHVGGPSTRTVPDGAMLGAFVDDYDERYIISSAEWVHLPSTTYRIVEWNRAERYLVAENAHANRQDGGRWTRIDWVELPGMPPYRWGFCYTAFNAATRAAARATPAADRAHPRTGCNGHPFSRMRGATGDSMSAGQPSYGSSPTTP